MGLFSFFTQELAIDLGTANTLIIHEDRVVVNEPSVVTIDNRTGKLVALGTKARQMIGKTHDKLRTIRPLRDGVIADYNAAELMIRGMINMIKPRNRFFKPSLKMVICIPSGSTEVEIRAVRDSSIHAGGRDIYMVYEPLSAAIGLGLDVNAPEGIMVVDIGGGTTEIAVISLGGIVANKSVRFAGDDFTQDIQDYIRQHHNLKIGERTAEQIKIDIGAAIEDIEENPKPITIQGPNLTTSLPSHVHITHKEVAHAIDKTLGKIEIAIQNTLEQTPPELYTDIINKGIYLAGGGALLRGIDIRFSERMNIPFHVADEPLKTIAIGTGIVLKNIEKYGFLMK